MTFRTKLLVDFADINPKHEKGTPPETPVSFVGMSDIDSESASVSREELRMFGETAKGFTQFKKGDILLAKITPCFENGKIAQATISKHLGSGSTEFHVIRAREGSADPRFLLHMLRHPKILFDGERKMTGSSGHRRVPEAYVANIKIPNYPLEIQEEVRASLDTLEFLRAMRRRSIELLDELTQSIFLDMFGDALDWGRERLGGIAEVQGGLQVTSKRKVYPIEIPYLRVANVYRGRLNLKEIKSIRVTEKEVLRTALKKGDILVVEGHGNSQEIGRVAVWDGSIDPCVHQNHLIRVRVDPVKMLPKFASSYLNSPAGRAHLLKSANTTSGLHTISTSDVRSCPIIVPPMGKQVHYVDFLEKIEGLKTKHLAHLAHLDELFASVQQRAFDGTLWDDSDIAS